MQGKAVLGAFLCAVALGKSVLPSCLDEGFRQALQFGYIVDNKFVGIGGIQLVLGKQLGLFREGGLDFLQSFA